MNEDQIQEYKAACNALQLMNHYDFDPDPIAPKHQKTMEHNE